MQLSEESEKACATPISFASMALGLFFAKLHPTGSFAFGSQLQPQLVYQHWCKCTDAQATNYVLHVVNKWQTRSGAMVFTLQHCS